MDNESIAFIYGESNPLREPLTELKYQLRLGTACLTRLSSFGINTVYDLLKVVHENYEMSDLKGVKMAEKEILRAYIHKHKSSNSMAAHAPDVTEGACENKGYVGIANRDLLCEGLLDDSLSKDQQARIFNTLRLGAESAFAAVANGVENAGMKLDAGNELAAEFMWFGESFFTRGIFLGYGYAYRYKTLIRQIIVRPILPISFDIAHEAQFFSDIVLLPRW